MRPTVFLRPQGTGPVAAVFHERDEAEIETTGRRTWLTVDARQIPGRPELSGGYLTLVTEEEKCEGGRLDFSLEWPARKGTKLFAHPAVVLPPIDAVFARGSESVGAWIASHGWDRTDRYNDNFKDRHIVREYEKVWMQEFPLYLDSDILAVLGGWHWPCADSDWHDLIDERLLIFTLRDSEPWVEAWQTRSGEFRVIQRIT